MQLLGIHHLTAITAQAARNHAFYTGTLGLRLVKKTVNQDDVSAYHLFYGDGAASPGSDLTFFDWPAARERRGTRSIARTALRVAGEPALRWWAERFSAAGMVHGGVVQRDGRATLDFEDPEGQRLSLVDDGGRGVAHPWRKSPVPEDRQIRGLGPVTLSVPAVAPTDAVLTGILNLRCVRRYRLPAGEDPAKAGTAETEVSVYAMGEGGAAAEVHLMADPVSLPARSGAGGVHHVAFRTTAADYAAWAEHLEKNGVASSGPVNRFYFQSLYFREPGGVLFEIATDEPGFAVDEPLESLGEHLALPPFLEPRRREIEAGLKPLP